VKGFWLMSVLFSAFTIRYLKKKKEKEKKKGFILPYLQGELYNLMLRLFRRKIVSVIK
jgi:hypothetical protein